MARKNKEEVAKNIDKDMSFIANQLSLIANSTMTQMPLFAKSILLSLDILKTYQGAFNVLQAKKTK